MGLLDQSKFLATYRHALFSKWHFYGFVCDIISCIKIWCLQQCADWQVNFLSNATKCIAHRNWVRMVVLVWRRTESSCWVIGGGAEDSREKVQLGDNNNKYESESEWKEQCLKTKNFHNSVMGGTHVSLWAREPLNSQNESQGTPTWIGITSSSWSCQTNNYN